MSVQSRYLKNQVTQDLQRKMVFLAGPRQIGKTHFSKTLPGGSTGYMNWDSDSGRDRILDRTFPNSRLWVFDEIHKYRKWRNYLKGIYDTKDPVQKILVTGSAKLDLYSFGGDSLQGRYHLLRMNPLSFRELRGENAQDLNDLFQLNGFPEPFFLGSKTELNRWSLEYRKKTVREEVNTLEKVEDLVTLELLLKLLPSRVGSPLSLNGLREDLGVAHATITKWCIILEKLYTFFRITPYGYKLSRAVKKEKKHYHYDWNLITEEGPRFENMIACHLKKWVDYQEDCFGEEYQLQYFRNTENKEVDFLITQGNTVHKIIECKLSDEPVSSALTYLKLKNKNAETWQISLKGKKDYLTPEGIRVAPAIRLLKDLI